MIGRVGHVPKEVLIPAVAIPSSQVSPGDSLQGMGDVDGLRDG